MIILRNWKFIISCAVIISGCMLANNYAKKLYNNGFTAGMASAQPKIDAAYKKIAMMEQEALKLATQHAAQMAKASEEYQKIKAENEKKQKVQYVEVQKIVEKPVYSNNCLSDDGVSAINRAIKGN